MHMHTHTHTHAHTHTCIHWYTQIRTHGYTQTHAHTHTLTQIHTHSDAHLHTSSKMYARKNSQLHHWTLSNTCCCLHLRFQYWKDNGYAVTYWANRNAAMHLLFNMTGKWLCFNWHDRKMAMLSWQESSYAVLTWPENGYTIPTGKESGYAVLIMSYDRKMAVIWQENGCHMTGKWLCFIHMQLLLLHERRLHCTDQKGK